MESNSISSQIEVVFSDDGINPIDYVRPYFSSLSDKDIAVLVGSIILLKEVPYKLLQRILQMEKIEIEEKLGRLVQCDLLEGSFLDSSFKMTKLNFSLKKQHPNLVIDDRIILAYLKARYKLSFSELQKAFDLNYESLFYTLATFVAYGLVDITMKNADNFEVVVYFKQESKSEDRIIDIEKQIVGYGILRNKTTISDIANDLDFPEHRVQTILIDLILSDMVLCNFQVESSLLKSIKLSIKIENFLIAFSKRDINVMNEIERLLIGFITMRGKTSINEIMEIFELSKVDLLRHISLLTATKEFEFELNDKERIIPISRLNFTTSRSLNELDNTSIFNYKVLLGMLKTASEISINELAKKMRARTRDVIDGIIELDIQGIIKAKLIGTSKVRISSIKNENVTSSTNLNEWERIILGALMAEGHISWPKIAAMLQTDREVARERAYELISRGIGRIEAKNSVLILTEKPQIPPLIQLIDLDFQTQQIFCYLVSMYEPSDKEIRSIFQLSSIELYREVYLLSGSGLLKIERNKKKFKISSPKIQNPTTPLFELDADLQLLVNLIERTDKDAISLKMLADRMGYHYDDALLDVSWLIGFGYYKGFIKGSKFHRTRGLFKVKEKPKCFKCSILLENYKLPCPNCEQEPPICSVCQGPLSTADDILICPDCNHYSHQNHIADWLRIKNECPICRRKLIIQQMITYTSLKM